mmetsp:Transcript_24618/g.39008  ORF Transcript_24618/g.39008 Transcript_24618/m.39008 type:complete len:84 (+) Transcript_24618:279-530(+)
MAVFSLHESSVLHLTTTSVAELPSIWVPLEHEDLPLQRISHGSPARHCKVEPLHTSNVAQFNVHVLEMEDKGQSHCPPLQLIH